TMALALPRRFRIPPFLPAYTILTLALAYAVITFSLGTARLDAIAQFAALARRLPGGRQRHRNGRARLCIDRRRFLSRALRARTTPGSRVSGHPSRPDARQPR